MAANAVIPIPTSAPSVPVSLGTSAAVGADHAALDSGMTLNTIVLLAQIRNLASYQLQ